MATKANPFRGGRIRLRQRIKKPKSGKPRKVTVKRSGTTFKVTTDAAKIAKPVAEQLKVELSEDILAITERVKGDKRYAFSHPTGFLARNLKLWRWGERFVTVVPKTRMRPASKASEWSRSFTDEELTAYYEKLSALTPTMGNPDKVFRRQAVVAALLKSVKVMHKVQRKRLQDLEDIAGGIELDMAKHLAGKAPVS